MKIVKGGSRLPNPGGRVRSKAEMQRALARQAAQERELARVIRITCGHFTYLEDQQLYAVWRPKRGLVFCEKCNKWLAVMPPPVAPDLPNEPMFLWLPTNKEHG